MVQPASPSGKPVATGPVACPRCGIPMRLINNARARLLLYWCPSCQCFAERHAR